MNKKCSDRDGISVFKRKDGRYEARVLDTRRFGSDGKRKYKSFYGATKKEAMDKAIAFLYEVKQGAYCDNSTVTVAECVNEWFEKRIKMKINLSHPYRINKGSVTLRNTTFTSFLT